jgi:hypothetical protein
MTPKEAKTEFEKRCEKVSNAMQSFIPIPGELLVGDLQIVFQHYRDAGLIVTLGGSLGGNDMAMFTKPEVFAAQIDDAKEHSLAEIGAQRDALHAQLRALDDAEEETHKVHAARMARLATGALPWP